MKSKVRGFFVTGTGTNVGKTYVSRLLVEGFSRRGPVSYLKPVQTGCAVSKTSEFSAPDFDYVKKSGMLVTGDYRIHAPYCFVPACSPHLAARLAGEKISLRRIGECLDKIGSLKGMRGGCVVVEGAGGVLAPLGASESVIHLILYLDLPVILVISPALGTLNHTALTMCALHSADVSVAGIVMNNRENCREDFVYKDNVKTVREYGGPVPFLEIKHRAKCNARTLEFCNALGRKFL